MINTILNTIIMAVLQIPLNIKIGCLTLSYLLLLPLMMAVGTWLNRRSNSRHEDDYEHA